MVGSTEKSDRLRWLLGIVASVSCIFWVILSLMRGWLARNFPMLVWLCLGIVIFPITRNMMGSCCLIRGVRLIDGGSQGIVLGCCMWMMRQRACAGRLYGCSRGCSKAFLTG